MSTSGRKRRTVSLAANPVLVGAVTTLVLVTAVFLAYNANAGLPFVPTFQLDVTAPNSSRLVVGNDVREGGDRVGQVTELKNVRRDGRVVSQITLAIDKAVTPLPDDSTIIIRPRSTLGLKYIDLVRGSSAKALEQGSNLSATVASVPPEFDDLFNMFDAPTREASRTNLVTFGDGLAGRGAELNGVFEDLPELLQDLVPVMQNLSDPDTRLRAFFRELGDAARITAPVSGALVDGFELGGDVFEAISRDPDALRDTIAESPPTLLTGIRELPRQRPFLARLAGLSDEITGTAAEIRRSVAPINRALVAGTDVLPETTRFNTDFQGALESIRSLAISPTTNITLKGLQATGNTLRPTLQYVGPQITVCNYWNYWWTLLQDHISEQVETGTLQRIQAKQAGGGLATFGEPTPANGAPNPPIVGMIEGDPVNLHAQPYGRAVDEKGNADCESGQRGYLTRVADGAPAGLNIAVDPRTPGNQGATFTGKPTVPTGQTFTAEPGGRAAPFFGRPE